MNCFNVAVAQNKVAKLSRELKSVQDLLLESNSQRDALEAELSSVAEQYAQVKQPDSLALLASFHLFVQALENEDAARRSVLTDSFTRRERETSPTAVQVSNSAAA